MVDLDWRTTAVLLLAFSALLAVTAVVRGATRAFTWLIVGTLLALALDPLVSRLKARVGGHRGIAVAIVLSGFLVAVLTLTAIFGPRAADQARTLGRDLPEVVDELAELPIIGPSLRDADMAERVEDALADLPERLAGDTAPLERAGRQAAGGALAAVATLLVAITLLLDGERLLLRVRRLVPLDHRDQADRLGRLLYRVVGQYFAGSVLVAGLAGFVIMIAALVLGVPLAPLLGAWVAVFNMVPQIGGAVSGIPFVVLGFTQGAGIGLACAVFFLLYQQFENNVLGPLVVGKAVDLSPPATMTAALIGVSAAGVVGALVAVPLLGAAKAVYLALQTGSAVEGEPIPNSPPTPSEPPPTPR